MPRQKRYCPVAHCGKPAYGHGFCSKHYLRWKRYGRLDLLSEQPRKGQAPRFPLPDLPRRELVIWAAGFIDGEGCIGICHRRDSHTYFVRITVPQVESTSIQTLQALFGGQFRVKAQKLAMPHHRHIYIWSVSARQAYEALLLIEPFLIVKKKQAQLAIELQKGIGRAIANSVTPEELQRREKIKQAISSLNQGLGQHLFL